MYQKYAKLRDSRGLRDADVARATGIKPQTLSAWKLNVSEPKLDKLLKIAELFGVSISELIGEK